MFGNIQRMSRLPEEAFQEIEQVHTKWLEFETSGDVRGLMALCADDIELWPPDAPPLIGCETVSASMTPRTVRIHGIEISERRIRGSHEVAYLTANYKTESPWARIPRPHGQAEAIFGYSGGKPTRGWSLW